MTTDKSIVTNLWNFYQAIDMPGGYQFNHPETIRMVDLYYNSKFKTGQYDSQGLRKFFFNVVKPTCDIATKFIDLDTKDIILIPEKSDEEFKVWVMQRRLKQWLKDSDFGCLLNDVSFDLPKYGTVVIKKCKDEDGTYCWDKVNIQNLRMDVASECLDDSAFIYELITMTRGEMEDMTEWDQQAVSDFLAKSDDETFLVYDCYHRKGKKWKHYVKTDMFSYSKDGDVLRSAESQLNIGFDYLPSTTLFDDELDDTPYRELHWEKVPGRWLGYGFVEYLEENQVAINEAENLERKGLAFKALQLWQTRDEAVGGQNVLTNTQNGDILRISSEVTPVQKDNSDLSAYNNTRGNWSQNIERKTFSTDITTGASLPSRTPLGVANLQASLASSYFELKRENFGLFIKDLVLEEIIPDFQKDTQKEHEMVFAGSDSELDKLDQAITEALVGEQVIKYAEKTGFFPSQQQRADLQNRLLSSLKKKQNRYLQVPKDFYIDCAFDIDVLITGENMDNGTRSQVLQLALQIVGTNPGILQSPMAKALFFQLLTLGGISPVDIGALQQADQQGQQQAQQQAQQGQPQQGQPQQGGQVAGSMAAPAQNSGLAGFARFTKRL